MKKWKCTVCGYIHTGDEPPEKCPVCGADKSKFIELEEEAAEPAVTQQESASSAPVIEPEPSAESPVSSGLYDTVTELMVKHHAHPVSTHIPNGVLPVSVLFILMAAMFNVAGLSQAAYYNEIFVLLSMPFVLFSGYNEWQRKYSGAMTSTFKVKIACGAVVSILTLVVVIWQMADPGVALHGSSHRGLFVFLNLIILGVAGVAGFLGGKLVFRD